MLRTMVQPCRRCGQRHDAYTGCTLAVRVAGRPTVLGEDTALVGNIVADRYLVREVIGAGSTGTVFGVEHVTFARPAAMKVLRPRFATAELVSRVFHGEARAAWSVSHPCLCEVFDIGALPDGAPFFVTERLEGETLATRITRERLSLAAAVDVLMQMLSAIAAIHARDLLLRDLRPENVYLAHRRGCRALVKILDFGLARLTPLDRLEAEWEALRATASAANDGVGPTAIPFYLSPERARGEHGVEPASDLFVAATIFYEALAGERPFASSSWRDLLAQITQGSPVPLHERRPEISPELSAFVARCLSSSPRQRPASAKEMQDELRATVEGGRKSTPGMLASASVAVAAAATAPAEELGSTFSSMAAPPMPRAPGAPTEVARPDHPSPRPPSGSYERGAGASYDVSYDEETETQRDAVHEAALARGEIPRLHLGELEDELSTAARRIDPALLFAPPPPQVDEASAESAERTVPPPPSIDVEIHFDDGSEIGGADPIPVNGPVVLEYPPEEEETETMQLTPELRARVDRLMATKPAPLPVGAGKPPRRR